MTSKLEEAPVGYPGFLVTRPPGTSLTEATLKRVALAKLGDITRMSAEFAGERLLFEPWLTVLVDYGRRAFVTGVYRTDSSEAGPDRPIWCLRKSEWLREPDMQRAQAAEDLTRYLTGGAQLASRLVFANAVTHPKVGVAMDDVLAALGSGITLSPAETRPHEWHQIELDLADDRLTCRIEYSPLIARSDQLETALPPWLARIDELLRQDGFAPDGEVTISIRRSVAELTR